MMKPANPGKTNPVSTHKLSLLQTPVYPSELERERYSPSARLQEAVEILGLMAGVRSVGCNNAGVVRHCASSLDSAPTSTSASASLSNYASSALRHYCRVQSSPAQVTSPSSSSSLSSWATREPAELQSHHLNPSSVQYLPNSPRSYPASKSSPSNLIVPQFSAPFAVEYDCMHRAASPRAYPKVSVARRYITDLGVEVEVVDVVTRF
ncbi:hypothetical protein D9757_011265 [Collybiopsis confluens]|uniref:Uncharacterized protein n=1 Tax=Collybiopsis confluens TaxID=2823264 RepID=A0A8H5LP65_9AGAR|nr:hypothetical protein D9757_011265 [Collybiopsis confluens]